MKFKYKAARSDGATYEGVGEFADKITLYHELKKKGETVISAKEVRKFSLGFSIESRFMGSVKVADKIGFAKNLGAMIEAGLSINRALSVMERQTKSKALKKVITTLIDEVSKGKELSASLQLFPNVFPSIFVSMVKAGEASGTVSESLRLSSSQMESAYLLKKKVKGAMMYPAIIICLIITVGILMLMYVVPTLSAVFKDLNTELPFATRMIIGSSDFIKENWLIAIIGAIAAGVGAYFGIRSRVGKRGLDFTILHFPLIKGMVQEVNSARTSRTLASLLSAGVDVVLAMDITKDVVQNSYYKEVIERAKGEIQKGNPISQVFSSNENLYPPFVGEMMSVGEETGKLGVMLANLATFYETEVEQKTKNLSTIIEPLLMIFIGGTVGFFAYAMLTPIYSVIGNIQ